MANGYRESWEAHFCSDNPSFYVLTSAIPLVTTFRVIKQALELYEEHKKTYHSNTPPCLPAWDKVERPKI